MDLADLVGLAGIIEDALGRRRLAGVDVRHDADVAIALERMAAGHDLTPGAGLSGGLCSLFPGERPGSRNLSWGWAPAFAGEQLCRCENYQR
jgi:hypothetical protein